MTITDTISSMCISIRQNQIADYSASFERIHLRKLQNTKFAITKSEVI